MMQAFHLHKPTERPNTMPTSLAQVLSHVPTYVWVILLAIVVMGVQQSREAQVSRQRALLMPLVWLAFGLWGVHNAFGVSIAALLAWKVGLACSLLLVLRSGWPGQARFNPEQKMFSVPGSWIPLALMLGIFLGKFALGMSLAIKPELAQNQSVAVAFGALFGALSGVFLGRSRNILSQGKQRSLQGLAA
jgi:hypothetical protein